MADKEVVIEQPEYNEHELEFRSRVLKDLENARTLREQAHPEFDDLTFTEYYTSNRRAGGGYNKPKQDESDVRVTTGTTMEKKNTLIAATISLNLDPEITAYDEFDRQVIELGKNMEDMVKKSREIDDWDDKKVEIYNEYYEQGFVCVEERFVEYRIPKKVLKGEGDKATWDKSDSLGKMYSECSGQLVEGINVYLGNIRESDIKKQPFVALRETKSRAEAEAMFGKWARWKYVPLAKTNTTNDTFWMLDDTDMSERAEIIRIFYKFSDDFNIMINGVMMLPVTKDGSYPMSALLGGVCEYPISWAVSDPMSDFAYGKSVPAKTKVDQAVLDNFIRNAVIKDNKHTNPPLANRTNQKISKRVYQAGRITDNLDAENLKPIGENNGVDQATVAAITMMKQNINEKSVDPVIEGQSTRGQRTAREVVELKEQSLQKMGLAIHGVRSLERQLAWLRIQNILTHWTKEKEKGIEGAKKAIYRTISIDTDFEDGTSGEKQIVFMDGELPDDKQVYAEEDLVKKITGKNVRRTYLNAKMLGQVKYTWKVDVNPTDKDSSEIRLAKFEESLRTLPFFLQLGKMPNKDYIADRWAILQGESPDRYWAQTQPAQPAMGGMLQPAQPQPNQNQPQPTPMPALQ